LISTFLITSLLSFGHCIVSPSLISTLLITTLVSSGHCIVSPSLISTFLITTFLSFVRRTDNTMAKR
jgi:hypothetical protein